MSLCIAALLTCHNRREKTVECLRALRAQILPGWNPKGDSNESRVTCHASDSSVDSPATRHPLPVASAQSLPERSVSAFTFQLSAFSLEVFLVDDGCTDGTAGAVREVWPEATIIPGSGNLFWCGGMRVAWAEAAKSDPAYYLLLNDDTIISPNALEQLLLIACTPDSESIAVGAIADPDTSELVYGGHRKHESSPVEPNGTPADCDTMNANCALVPRRVFQTIGMFYPAYTHAMGDYDYGFAAKRSGLRVVQTPARIGTCTPNPPGNTWRDVSLPRLERLRLLWLNPKGLPFWEWATYARRNMGWIWPYRCISPALRILAGK